MDNYDKNHSPVGPTSGLREDTRTMRLKDWIITLLILLIPCVNIVMLFVWGFGSGNVNRRNYCRAQLLMYVIIFVFYLVLDLVFGIGSAMITQIQKTYNF